MKFKLFSDFKATFDQKKAVERLIEGYLKGIKYQVLLGVTGSGKTFTIANVIEKLQKPALIISHNKTLAAQLYQEFKSFFPENAVCFFVSYYDYYQPEAYLPATDTYIEKDADINELIDKLRLETTTNLLTRRDTIVVASVSCIYNIGSPREYGHFVLELSKSLKISQKDLINRLIQLQYERSDFEFSRGTFRVIGNTIDVFPSYKDEALKIELEDDIVKNLTIIDPLTGRIKINDELKSFVIYPAKHYITDPETYTDAFSEIRKDLEERVSYFKKRGKILEANRIKTRVEYDLEMIKEVGYVKGIENYSRYFDGRKPGDPPYTLLDYFREPYNNDFLVVIDESHITFPQIRGMYQGDLSRKKTLVEYGFRLPAAYDNRPLIFSEFMQRIPNFIATSATPGSWEVNLANKTARMVGEKSGVVEQLLRPTGIPDPKIIIRKARSQVSDAISEIQKNTKRKQRTLITTLTKKTAEDLTFYLKERNIKCQYLHSDIETLERTDILEKLRKGDYDVVIGVNLLREGLDLPEVSLVLILDADKEGFLRSEVSLIQTMGRAARHKDGRVILYADKLTGSMKKAIKEVERRRRYQLRMNKKFGIKPRSIIKPIRQKIITEDFDKPFLQKLIDYPKDNLLFSQRNINLDALTPLDKKRLVRNLRKEMLIAAKDLNFELAAAIRDKINSILASM